MGNHDHLVIETPEPDLRRGLRRLHGTYTQWFNRGHQRVGHLLQGRFKSLLVEKECSLQELCRYGQKQEGGRGVVIERLQVSKTRQAG
jgi:putative transposase